MKPLLIYIAPSKASFVLKDIKILSNDYDVICPDHNWRSKRLLPFTFIRQLFFLLVKLPSTQVVLVMFGGYSSFIPCLLAKLYGKPAYIILGGMDCVSFPALNYGSLRKPFLKWIIGQSYRLCTRLLPVDESLAFSENTFVNDEKMKMQGFNYHFPKLKKGYTVISNGFSIIDIPEKTRKINSFITVAGVDSRMRFRLKGIDLILNLAKELPLSTFTVVGCDQNIIPNGIPTNVVFYGFLPQHEITDLLLTSEFYIQPSLSEGFPNALGEGMMHGCIPIVSNTGAMPQMIGSCGCILRSQSIEEVISELTRMIELDPSIKSELSRKSHLRILTEYPLDRRKRELLTVINSPY